MTPAQAPVSRREMIELIEKHIRMLSTVVRSIPESDHSYSLSARRLQIYVAISLKLRMEDPNAQD